MTMIDDVRLFHETYDHPIADRPIIPPKNRKALRLRLIQEELNELKEADASHDVAGVADALADLIYFTIGTALEWGIPLQEVWDEVQRTNMAKLHTEEQMRQQLLLNPGWRSKESSIRNKYVVYDEGGKVRKPPGWKAPDIQAIISKAMELDKQEANRAAANAVLSTMTTQPPEHS